MCTYYTEEIMEELVEKAQKGDKEAFTQLIHTIKSVK